MLKPLGYCDGFGCLSDGLFSVSAMPSKMGKVRSAKDLNIRSGEQVQNRIARASEHSERLIDVLQRRRYLAEMKQAASEEEIPKQRGTGSRLLFGSPQKFDAELPCSLQIAADDVEQPCAAENHENIAMTEASRKLESPCVCCAYLWR